jgi:hypothetical protein
MGELLPYLVVGGSYAAVVAGLVWLAARVRRRGIGGGFVAPVEEIFRPTAHDSRIEIEVQAERMMAMPSPEDKPHWSLSPGDRAGGVEPWT